MNKKIFEIENTRINISPMLQNKLDIITSEYKEEIGGYLIGEVKDGVIFLQDILIPPQAVSGGSVEITPVDQIALYRKYGDKCKKILAHFHSHNNMGCFWSNTDLINMRNIMEYKDFYIFIVGSNKKYLVKICTKKPFKVEFDNFDLYIKSTRLDNVRSWVNKIIGKTEEPDVSEVEVIEEDDDESEEIVSEISNDGKIKDIYDEEHRKELTGDKNSYIG